MCAYSNGATYRFDPEGTYSREWSEGAHTPLEEVIAELRFHKSPKARGEVAPLDSSVLGHCFSLAFREIILHRLLSLLVYSSIWLGSCLIPNLDQNIYFFVEDIKHGTETYGERHVGGVVILKSLWACQR